MSTNVKFLCTDGEIVEVDIKVAKLSGTIKTLLETCRLYAEDDGEMIPLTHVRGRELKLIFEWAGYHKDDEIPVVNEDCIVPELKMEDFCSWDLEFAKKIDWPVIFEMINAANYLEIERLLDLLCKVVANMIGNSSAEEIRENCKLQNDFTPEEEDEIRKENEKFVEDEKMRLAETQKKIK